jgi:hypothetical protein
VARAFVFVAGSQVVRRLGLRLGLGLGLQPHQVVVAGGAHEVGRVDHRHAVRGELGEEGVHCPPAVGVEHRCRLVRDDQLRLAS